MLDGVRYVLFVSVRCPDKRREPPIYPRPCYPRQCEGWETTPAVWKPIIPLMSHIKLSPIVVYTWMTGVTLVEDRDHGRVFMTPCNRPSFVCKVRPAIDRRNPFLSQQSISPASLKLRRPLLRLSLQPAYLSQRVDSPFNAVELRRGVALL